MNVIRFLYFIATIVVEVAKNIADADDFSLLEKSLVESKHILRSSGSNDEKETEKKDETSSIKQSPKRMLEVDTKRLLQSISINNNDNCCEEEYEEIFTASDGSDYDYFGASCSISDDFVVIGAPYFKNRGAAYLFNLNGTEVAKLTPGNDEEDYDWFGGSVSMDEKVVVGSVGNYVRVFSRDGTYERTLTCDDCSEFGKQVATHGNLIVTKGEQNSLWKLFIYSTGEGHLLKTIEQGSDWIYEVTISEQVIVTTSSIVTTIYSNSSPDFPKIAEIHKGGTTIAVSNDRIAIGHWYANGYDGAVYLYKTDGTLVKTLDRQDASSGSWFGESVAITDDKVIVGAAYDNNSQGKYTGSVFIYSADTGEFIKKVLAPDGECTDYFGYSVCASDSHYAVGAPRVDWNTGGAAYLFQFSEE